MNGWLQENVMNPQRKFKRGLRWQCFYLRPVWLDGTKIKRSASITACGRLCMAPGPQQILSSEHVCTSSLQSVKCLSAPSAQLLSHRPPLKLVDIEDAAISSIRRATHLALYVHNKKVISRPWRRRSQSILCGSWWSGWRWLNSAFTDAALCCWVSDLSCHQVTLSNKLLSSPSLFIFSPLFFLFVSLHLSSLFIASSSCLLIFSLTFTLSLFFVMPVSLLSFPFLFPFLSSSVSSAVLFNAAKKTKDKANRMINSFFFSLPRYISVAA